MHNQPKQTRVTILIFGAMALLCGGAAFGAPFTVTNDFVPNTPAQAGQVNQNFQDIEEAITTLQTGARPREQRIEIVDCTTPGGDPDYFQQPEFTDFFSPNTVYQITGVCNGPIRVTSNGIVFLGMEANRASTIVMPPSADPSSGLIFADGAHNLRIENLTLDVTAFDTWAEAAGTDAGTVYAKNGIVRVRDSDLIGSLYGANPFRNATIEFSGTVNITGFVNSGITVGEQSVVKTFGPLNISTTNTDQNYLNAIETYRTGVIDIRNDLVVTVPAQLDNNDPAYAVVAGGNGEIRVRSFGSITINGNMGAFSSARLRMDGGTLIGDIDVSSSGFADLNVDHVINANTLVESQIGDIFVGRTGKLDLNIFGAQALARDVIGGSVYIYQSGFAGISNGRIAGQIDVVDGSHLELYNTDQSGGEIGAYNHSRLTIADNSDVGLLGASLGSTLSVNGGSSDGVDIEGGSTALISSHTVTGSISASRSSSIEVFDGIHSGGDVESLTVSSIFFQASTINTTSLVFEARRGSSIILVDSDLTTNNQLGIQALATFQVEASVPGASVLNLGGAGISCHDSNQIDIDGNVDVTNAGNINCP